MKKNYGLNDNVVKMKKENLTYILLISVFVELIILVEFIIFIICSIAKDYSLFLVSIFFALIIFVVLAIFFPKYKNYLIYGREKIVFPKENVEEEKNVISISGINNFDARVEGIVGNRERDIIDQDDDGYILVHEFYPLTEEEILVKVMRKDTDFSKKDFCDYVKSLFLLIQEAWSKNDYSKLRSFEADRLYYRHKKEIERLINEKIEDIRENVKIKGVLLKDFRIENNKQILIVALTANIIRRYDYEKTQKDYPYIMVFSRNVGVKTNKKVKLSVTNCCNCGAEVNVSDDGICKYCDTSLVSGEHEWVLVDMKLINIDPFSN